MEEVVAGIRAGRSCLLTSQRLLRCVSAHSTGDPTGVYPHFPNCQLPSSLPPPVPQPGPLLPLSLTRIILQIWEAGVVAFSSGNGGPLHPDLPPLLSASSPTLLLAGLDRQTMKMHRACSVSSLYSPCVWWSPWLLHTLTAPGSRLPGTWMVHGAVLTAHWVVLVEPLKFIGPQFSNLSRKYQQGLCFRLL